MPRILAAAAWFTVGSIALARAEPIPTEWLQEQHAACTFSCGKSPANDPKDCETACSCVDREMSADLTREQYLTIERTLQQQKKLPVELSEVLRTINDRCALDPSGL